MPAMFNMTRSLFQNMGMRVCDKDLVMTPYTRGAAACTAWMFRKGWVMQKVEGKWVRNPIAYKQVLTTDKDLQYAVLMVHQSNIGNTAQQ
jgi:hypothetical protein